MKLICMGTVDGIGVCSEFDDKLYAVSFYKDTMANLRGTLSLGLKGRLYTVVAFVYLMGTFYTK